jgi:hypothetical protein
MTRRSWLAILVAVAACSKPPEAALRVVVSVPAGSLSKYVDITVGDQHSGCAHVKTDTLEFGVSQGTFANDVTVRADGFVDSACTQSPSPTESGSAMASFLTGKVVTVAITLSPAVPRVETDCGDGVDNDGDGKIDCADSDCDAKACFSGNVCVENQVCSMGQCVGGNTVHCMTPPTCFKTGGNCVLDAGCRYQPDPGIACDDLDVCTTGDLCSATGVCTGTPKTCPPPPRQCLKNVGCDRDAGCQYGPAPGDSCSDGDSCTVGDTCDGDGGCAGTRVSCQATQCQVPRAACLDDGGCEFDAIDAGTACGDAGVCNSQGGCIEPLAFVPSNVAPTAIPTFPASGTVVACPLTIDTGSGDAGPMVVGSCASSVAYGWNVAAQDGGVPALVLSFASLDVTVDGGLSFVGVRPPIIISKGHVTVLGSITSAAGASPCVGAGAGGDANASGNGGGGGGAFGSAGGHGGTGNAILANNGAGAAGSVNGDPSLAPLRGGCPGGRGGGRAGAGGGALQLSAGGDVQISGVVSAPGHGGPGGAALNGANGAGSGGGVLIEGLTVTVSGTGAITANGGGGGQGGGLIAGQDGFDGTFSATAAAGGASVPLLPPGGAGGALSTDGVPGSDATIAGAAGAGGGGVGRVRLRAAIACNLGAGTVVSPPPTSDRADAGCQ